MTARGERALTATQQAYCLRAWFPDASITVCCNRLTWVGVLRPTALSEDYEVVVTYAVGQYPVVRVLSPRLLPRPDGQLPHYFRQGSLCLHERFEWGPSMRLVDTTLPWTVEWLAHYELWRPTGLWYGDGDFKGRQLHGAPDDDRGLPRWARRRRRVASVPLAELRSAA